MTRLFWRRTGAWAIDFGIGIVLFVVAVRALGEARPSTLFDDGYASSGIHASLSFGDTEYDAEGGRAALVFLLTAGWGLVNSVLVTGSTGASLGKHLLGLRVVRPDGSLCGPTKALVRWLLLVVDAFPYFVPIVGMVMVGSTRGNRRLGDMAADTYVVRTADAGRPVALDGPPAAYGGTPPAGGYGAPPSAVSPPTEPQWDPARNAWIRWDGSAWLQHDTASSTWTPLR